MTKTQATLKIYQYFYDEIFSLELNINRFHAVCPDRVYGASIFTMGVTAIAALERSLRMAKTWADYNNLQTAIEENSAKFAKLINR